MNKLPYAIKTPISKLTQLTKQANRNAFFKAGSDKEKVDKEKVAQFVSIVNEQCLNDSEIFNVAVNYSIIKHNEFKSYNIKENQETRNNTGVENLDFKHVANPEKSQDFQI